MDIDLSALPDDVETLQRMVRGLAAERTALSEAQAEIERLRLIVQKLQRSQFGRRAACVHRPGSRRSAMTPPSIGAGLPRSASPPPSHASSVRACQNSACRRAAKIDTGPRSAL